MASGEAVHALRATTGSPVVKRVEAAIIGGGPAGLSAALVLARASRKIAVIDACKPRNSVSPGVHAFLSRDGILPADLKKISRKQIAGYPDVDFISQPVRFVRAAQNQSGFDLVMNSSETLRADTVLLAVGMIDELPDLPGFDQHWGHSVIHCPFCHGFENRGGRWGLLAKDLDDVAKAEDLRFWTDELTVFADQRLHVPDDRLDKLAASNIAVHRGTIRRLISSGDGVLRAIELQDGTQVLCDTIMYRPKQRQTNVVMDSGVALSETGRVWIDDHYQTSIPGIFAAGDLTPGCQDALAAAAEGAKAAKSALSNLGISRAA